MVRRGHLDVPVVGVAKAGWNLDQLRERARDSLVQHGGGVDEAAFAKLLALAALRRRRLQRPRDLQGAAQGARRRPRGPCTTWPSRRACSAPWSQALGRIGLRQGRARDHREAVRPRPGLGARRSTRRCTASSPSRRSSASTTTSARRRCRTSSSSASPTPSSSRSGTATTSRACRSRWPRTSASRAAAPSTTRPARSATSSQNHMLQVVGFLAMEPPTNTYHESIRDEQVKVFRMIRPLDPDDLVRGQFRGYLAGARREAGLPGRDVRRRAALHVDSWRWEGVPFLIRAGKNLPVTTTEVLVTLKRPPLTHLAPGAGNHVRFRLSPEVEIAIGARVKRPGGGFLTEPAELRCVHQPTGDDMDAYERLLGDAMDGDAMLFAREDAVEAAWQIVEPILKTPTPVYAYEPGTWGPPEADAPRRRHRRLACAGASCLTRVPVVDERPAARRGHRGDLDPARVVRGGGRQAPRGRAGAVREPAARGARRDRARVPAAARAGDRRGVLRGRGAGRRRARGDAEPVVGRRCERGRARARSAAGRADQ